MVGPSASFKPAAAKACTLGQAYNQNLSHEVYRNLNVKEFNLELRKVHPLTHKQKSNKMELTMIIGFN